MDATTLERIALGLCARDIAAGPVVHAGVDEDLSTLGELMRTNDFSHMPLRDTDGQVVRVLHRSEALGRSGRAYDAAVPLDYEKHLVAAEDPLSAVISKLAASGFLLVRFAEARWPDRVEGIINHADVVTFPVRLLLYTRTIQLEQQVFEAVAGTPWSDLPEFAAVWRRADRKYQAAGEHRSRHEVYLQFSDLMRIGQRLGVLQVSEGELKLLSTARNFACHAVIPGPGEELSPEEIPGEVEGSLRLVERLVSTVSRDSAIPAG
jgi:CBS domain-containing protein